MKKHKEEIEKLIEQHSDALYSTALRMTSSHSDSEDLLQVTFMKAFTAYPRLKDKTNLKAWLFKIMTNTFINNYRQNHRRPNHVSSDECELENWEPTDSREISEQIAEMDSNKLEFAEESVKRAVESVPAHFRSVFLLITLGDLSYQEVSAILGCPLGTVMSRLHRARMMIREKLVQKKPVKISTVHPFARKRQMTAVA